MAKARINTGLGMTRAPNRLGSRVAAQAQIPSRSPFDDPSAFEASCGKILSMKAHMAYPWHMEVCSIGGFKRIGKRNTGELITLALKPGLLGQLLIAALPGRIRGVEPPLQRMTGDAELFAVVSQQIVKRFGQVSWPTKSR